MNPGILGTWEPLYNPDFKAIEFDHFKMEAGLPSFVLSPSKWVEITNAIGIFTKKANMEALIPIKTLL